MMLSPHQAIRFPLRILSRPQFAKRVCSSLALHPIGEESIPPHVTASFQPLDAFSFIEQHTLHRNPLKTEEGRKLFAKILGHANEYKEGDETIGVAAPNQESRNLARRLLSFTLVSDIERYPYMVDEQYRLCREVDAASAMLTQHMTLSELKHALLYDENRKSLLPGLSSDVIGCVVKLMSNQELVHLGSHIFNSMPGCNLGAKGYFGARIQPNSPTDDPEDIFWQVLSAFSFGVGDVMLGTNPVSSDPESVLRVQHCLKDIVDTFKLDFLPWCVLSHIDIQHRVEQDSPGSTSLWFQSIAGSDAASQTFDLPLDKLVNHAKTRASLYLETGQGADFTNGHSRGIDMIMHDARKYGLARALKSRMQGPAPQLYINDVAGFIGPECFKTREQIVRVCLEDIALGKLHGLTVGLDICATLHMQVSLEDLNWCIDEIMPAHPAWAMALPTKNDPMLSYLTTSFQDHVRIRHKFGFKVEDRMWEFFSNELGVVDFGTGQPTEHFGDPCHVYVKYCQLKGDKRSREEIAKEAQRRIQAVQAKGVPIAMGHGKEPWDLNPELHKRIEALYHDAKKSLWSELGEDFSNVLMNQGTAEVITLSTCSVNRQDFVFHPETGEKLSRESTDKVTALMDSRFRVAIVISDGLCADSIMDHDHLKPFLTSFRAFLTETCGHEAVRPDVFLISNGRVRAGYEVGNLLFADTRNVSAIVHIIGERPGNGHHTFSSYVTVTNKWSDKVDHDITQVISGVADTSYDPAKAGRECAEMVSRKLR